MIHKVLRKFKYGAFFPAISRHLVGVGKRVSCYKHWSYRLDPLDWMVREFSQQFAIPDASTKAFDNYRLDSRHKLTRDSVVYSFGILTECGFEQELANHSGATIHMYDPTPNSQEFMKAYENYDRFVYHPIGVWTQNTTMRFSQPFKNQSASFVFDAPPDAGTSFSAECKTLEAFMAANNHSHIDVLKMDIEGAALHVCEYMVEKAIFPTQIVVEFERFSSTLQGTAEFIYRVSQLVESLHAQGYQTYLIPRPTGDLSSLEFLFTRRT